MSTIKNHLTAKFHSDGYHLKLKAFEFKPVLIFKNHTSWFQTRLDFLKSHFPTIMILKIYDHAYARQCNTQC